MLYRTLFAVLLAVCVPQIAFSDFSFTSFGSGLWGANDAVLGVSGYSVEDFEDTQLVSDLLISISSVNGGYGPSGVIPNTFNPFTDSTFGTAFQTGGGGAWDGSRGLINTRTNREFPYTEGDSWGTMTFHFASPATSVGFSVQQLDVEAMLYINGVSQGGLATLAGWSPTGGRQGYFRIDGTSGSTISTLEIRNGSVGVFRDGIMIDHLAFSSVPEPSTVTFLAAGLSAITLLRTRRRR